VSRLRLLADDLTGALDVAAQFTGALGPVTVRFRPDDWRAPEGALAFDSATREADESRVSADLWRLARFFAGARLAFKRIDGTLRGHAAFELERAFHLGGFRSCVIAPAEPARGLATRGGAQHARARDGAWQPVRGEFAGDLRALGLDLRIAARPDAIGREGAFLCDAETDADLRAIAAAGERLAPPVLWCGTAALARALVAAPPRPEPVPPEPLLAIVGSHHPVTRAQLDRVEDARPELWIAVREGAAEAEEVRGCLAARGAALVTFLLPDYMFDAEAARRLEAILAELLPQLDAPAGLFVSGSETLRGVAGALDAEALEVVGEIAPGLPAARLRGGLWSGLPVVSKSGAAGDADLLATVLARPGEPLGE
jgi:uncharacterized protein YgbK (DUF1537 family)